MPELLLLIPGVIFPVLLVISERKGAMKTALLFKTLSSAVFVLLGFLIARQSADPERNHSGWMNWLNVFPARTHLPIRKIMNIL